MIPSTSLKPTRLLSRVFVFAVNVLLVIVVSTNISNAQWTRKADELVKRAEANDVIYKNKLYVFGGFGDNPIIEKTNEVYDIAANKWSTIASIPAGKEITHQGVVLVDDNIWLIGGRAVDAHGPVSSQVLIYNITTNTWSDGPRLIDPATHQEFPIGAAGYVLVGRTIHVFGGFGPTICDDQATLHLTIDVDKYMANRSTVTWENKLAPMPIPRHHISYVFLAGKIYAFGGQFKHDCGANDQVYCHVYDVATDTWTRLKDLPKPRSHAEGATFAVDGKIFLVAGQGFNNVTQNTTYQYTPQANNGPGTWTDLSAYRLPGSYLGLTAKIAGTKFIITNGAKDSYADERKETYIANVTRTTKRTLGFVYPCFTKSVNNNGVDTISNLLYSVEDDASYTAISDAPWLKIIKNQTAIATLNSVDIKAVIDASGLAPGNYNANITATNIATNSKASFCVNITVNHIDGYLVTVNTTGQGTVTKTPDKSYYALNDTVVLNATAAAGWKFKTWGGDTTSTDTSLTLVVDTNRNINAVFEQLPTNMELVTNVSATSGRSYQTASMATGLVYYTDRTYKITSVPAVLANATIIRTANDDKASTVSQLIKANLTQNATVYIAYDTRGTQRPAWLATGWTKLSETLPIDDPKLKSFALYSKAYQAGNVSFGGNMASPAKGALCQYLVIVKGANAAPANTLAFNKATTNSLSSAAISDNNPDNDLTIQKFNKLVIYPNPVIDNFDIIFPKNYKGLSGVKIVDLNRGSLMQIPLSVIRNTSTGVNVSVNFLQLRSGVYSVITTSKDGKTDVVKFIKN
ncbi:MAG: T9SS type A sorting domain-containing protein [Mucilaginibacter sp.]|nr:T9SS type A sorting domain-containing protein [Mucilaginibacter sp.]